MSSYWAWKEELVARHDQLKPFAPENGRLLRFAVGDPVLTINGYGLILPGFKIVGFYKPKTIDSLYAAGYRYLIDWACHWFPVAEKELIPLPHTPVMEQVLVISRELFDTLGAFQGFQKWEPRWLNMFQPLANHFVDRAPAEENPGLKQLISYSIFHRDGLILSYRRGSASAEARLQSKISVGIGGHVNPIDAEHAEWLSYEGFKRSLEREVQEELDMRCGFQCQLAGLINDDSNPVGQVHLGIVHLCELDSLGVRAREDSLQGLQFLSKDRLLEQDTLETWSRMCLEALF